VFLRNVAGLLFIMPWLLKVGIRGLKTKRVGFYCGRGLSGFLSMISWFYAVSVLPLADAVSLNFTAPIFGTVLAIFILGEKVGIRRGTAMIVGFAGAMIILRPGFTHLNLGSYAALISAVGMAMSIMFVKLLSRTESTPAIVAWTQIWILPMSFLPAMFVWQTPTLHQIMLILTIGLLATFGHLSFTRAYSLAEASLVMPFDFFRLIFSAAIGFIFFLQSPDIYTYIGAAVIFSSSIYIAIRESRQSRIAAKPDGPEVLAHATAEASSGPGR
ncbi:MAG: DMT family transporter, partial [Alphaproteobacteria bacterium]